MSKLLILKIYNLIFKKKILFKISYFKKPLQKKIIIYDPEVAIEYKNLYSHLDFIYLHTRYEFFYLRIIIKAIKKFLRFKKHNIYFWYFVSFIEVSDPAIIVGFTDYDHNFWKLKKFFPNKIFFLSQHNYRYGWGTANIFDFSKSLNLKKKENFVDFFFCFGKNTVKKYNNLFQGKKIVVGSLKSNSIQNNKNENKNSLVLISQFKVDGYNSHFKTSDNLRLSLMDWKLAVLNKIKFIILEYAQKNNYELLIFPRQQNKYLHFENNFYQKVFKMNNIKFINRTNGHNIYSILSKYRNFISIGSTLGYELLSMSKRVFCYFDQSFKNIQGINNYNFGWPKYFKKNGWFWTSSEPKKSHFCRIMDFTFKSKDNEWKKVKKKTIDKVIYYNKDNLIYKSYLNKFIR